MGLVIPHCPQLSTVMNSSRRESRTDRVGQGRRTQGFTLIEVMVALAILAFTGVALLTAVNRATNDVGRMGDTLAALNVAESELNMMLIQHDFPDVSSENKVISYVETDWDVVIDVTETPNESVRRIDVQVQRTDGLSRPFLLSGFKADLK